MSMIYWQVPKARNMQNAVFGIWTMSPHQILLEGYKHTVQLQLLTQHNMRLMDIMYMFNYITAPYV